MLIHMFVLDTGHNTIVSTGQTFYIFASRLVMALGKLLCLIRHVCVVAFVSLGKPQWHRITQLEWSIFLFSIMQL